MMPSSMTGQAGVNGRTLTNVDDVVVRGCDGSGTTYDRYNDDQSISSGTTHIDSKNFHIRRAAISSAHADRTHM